MNQVLSYCTARIFSHGFIPLVALRPRTVDAHNDNRPEGVRTVAVELSMTDMARARRHIGPFCAQPKALSTPA
jgi:hypothetical protein